MAWRKTHRFLIERSNEDAKDEFGWDEFQTRKYRVWKYQLDSDYFGILVCGGDTV